MTSEPADLATISPPGVPSVEQSPKQRYLRRDLSYASTFDNPWQASVIRTLEWLTGKLSLVRMVRRFEREGPEHGQAFWRQALDIMGIDVATPVEQVARIPATGPLVVVANHPHGLVDGMILGELIGRVRQDYRILTRSLLTGVDEIAEFMIPVPFQHASDAREKNLEMRHQAMDHLKGGGAIVLFPAGVVASARRMFGPAVEEAWNPFTAKMIQRSGAQVLPVHFPGQNSRAYQIANLISPVLRQGLLLHEVVKSCHQPQGPVIGQALGPEDLAPWAANPRGLVAWLREHTLALTS